MVWPQFAVWLLVDPKHGVVRHTKKGSAQYVAIHRVATLYSDLKDWDKRDKAAFQNADADADAAARSSSFKAQSEKLLELLEAA